MWRWSSCLKLTHIHNNGGGTSESVSIIRVFKGTCQANRNSLQSTNCYSRPETIGNTTKLTIHYSSNIPNPMFRLWVQRVSNISCTLQLSVKAQRVALFVLRFSYRPPFSVIVMIIPTLSLNQQPVRCWLANLWPWIPVAVDCVASVFAFPLICVSNQISQQQAEVGWTCLEVLTSCVQQWGCMGCTAYEPRTRRSNRVECQVKSTTKQYSVSMQSPYAAT